MCKFLSIIKTKTDLIEMIVYGCFTEILNKKEIEDISTKEANLILDKSNITIKSLLGYGNASLKWKEIKPNIFFKLCSFSSSN